MAASKNRQKSKKNTVPKRYCQLKQNCKALELELKSGAEQSRTAVQTGYLPSAHSQA